MVEDLEHPPGAENHHGRQKRGGGPSERPGRTRAGEGRVTAQQPGRTESGEAASVQGVGEGVQGPGCVESAMGEGDEGTGEAASRTGQARGGVEGAGVQPGKEPGHAIRRKQPAQAQERGADPRHENRAPGAGEALGEAVLRGECHARLREERRLDFGLQEHDQGPDPERKSEAAAGGDAGHHGEDGGGQSKPVAAAILHLERPHQHHHADG